MDTESDMDGVESLTKRQAVRVLNGVSFPAIIHNSTYFLSDIHVFEDGLIDCWEVVDLPLFRKKVASGWVKTQIPEGAKLHTRELGQFEVTEPTWAMDSEGLVSYVDALIGQLNPSRSNLFDMEGDPFDRSTPIPVAKVSRLGADAYRLEPPRTFLGKRLRGKTRLLFRRGDGVHRIVQASVFSDERVRITGGDEPLDMTLSELIDEIKTSDAYKFPEPGERICIRGLCEFVAGEVTPFVAVEDLPAELNELLRGARGQPASTTRVAQLFAEYCEDPTREALERVRAAYEAVPPGLRCFCGDQDVKDIPIRIALYGEQEIERWSHYAYAKSKGERLPSIDVPKPKDDADES